MGGAVRDFHGAGPRVGGIAQHQRQQAENGEAGQQRTQRSRVNPGRQDRLFAGDHDHPVATSDLCGVREMRRFGEPVASGRPFAGASWCQQAILRHRMAGLGGGGAQVKQVVVQGRAEVWVQRLGEYFVGPEHHVHESGQLFAALFKRALLTLGFVNRQIHHQADPALVVLHQGVAAGDDGRPPCRGPAQRLREPDRAT